MRNALYLTFYLLFLSSFVLGQTNLDEVVVSSPRLSIPFSDDAKSITVITAKQIAATPFTTLADVLRFQAGLDIRRQGIEGAQADVYLRGGTFDQVLLLIDGIRVDDPQTGHHTLNSAIPVEVIERIEIVKGPAARIYGQNAFTGAINIVTKKSGTNGAALSLRQGSFNTNHLGLTAQATKETQQHVFHVSKLTSDGYRHNTDLDNRHFFSHSIFGDSKKIKLMTMFNERKFGANGFYGVAGERGMNQYEKTQSSLVALSTTFSGTKTSWTPRIFWKRGQDEYIFIRNNPSVYRNLHINNKVGFSLDTQIAHANNNRTGFGIELSSVGIRSNNLGDHNRTIAHLFFEHRFNLSGFSITPGFALSHFSDVDTFFYPGMDIGLRLSEKEKLTFNTGYTYRVPTYTDLYYNGPQAIGNASLKPEQALSHEIGYRYAGTKLSLEAAIFQRNSKDLIDYVEVIVGDPKWLASNVQQVTTLGGELNATFSYGSTDSTAHTLTLAYAYIDDDYTKTVKSRYSLNSLRHSINIQAVHTLFTHFSSTLSYRYASRALGGHYQLVNAQLEYRSGKWRLQAQGRNLFNAAYVENLIPMPKAHGVLGVSYSF